VFALSGALVGGCSVDEHTSAADRSGPKTSSRVVRVDALGQDRASTLRALALPHAYLAARLGAHRVKASSLLVTRLPGAREQRVEQTFEMRTDARGNYAASKHTDPQYGNEVVWTGGRLYARLRYSKFVKRAARPGEPRATAERLYGYLPAYVGLLGRFIAVEAAGQASYQGRSAVKVRLKLDPGPAPPRTDRSPGRGWRRTMVAKSIKGEALLDARSGSPLSVKLAATWTFNPPRGDLPRSGIPTAINRQAAGTMSLTFSQQLDALGQVPPIPPPAGEEIVAVERRRLEIERQMLLGERPLPGRVGSRPAGGAGGGASGAGSGE